MATLNASVSGIAQRLGVRPSLFTYHYKNIQSLIQIINRNFHGKIWQKVSEKNISDPLIFLFAYDLLVNTATYSTPESRRFKCETSASNKVSMYALHSEAGDQQEIDDRFYMEILNYHHVKLSIEMLSRLRIQESAGRREIYIKYYETDMYQKLSEDKWYEISVSISYCTITTVFRFAGIPNTVIDQCFLEAFYKIYDIPLEELQLI